MAQFIIRKTAQVLLMALTVSPGCKKKSSNIIMPSFVATPVSTGIVPGLVDEASGIADSKANPGNLWVEQDSGNPNDLILLSYNGTVVKKINIKPSVNRDWEDIAIANGPVAGSNYIYLADIGDNNSAYPNYTIYRFTEPLASVDTVFNVESIRFQYPDGSHDAEAIVIDNATKDIYVITKRDNPSRLYKIAYPQNTLAINMAALIGSLSFSGVVGAALSASGNELLVKTYTSIFYWNRSRNESIGSVIMTSPVALSYQLEPQGEAICFKNDNTGFYTLSERPAVVTSVSLNFYKRN
jgi:hypothetical protein